MGNESLWADEGLRQLIALCREGAKQQALPVLELQGLLPVRDWLVDRPLSGAEFDMEERRKASRRPRWASLLQRARLRELKAACPGAGSLIAFRLACVGYFIAE